MEFHLPYCALRRADGSFDPRNFDPRGLRRAYPMLPNYRQPQDQLYYYDAQISVLVTGVVEWYWTAYCCVDTFAKEPEKVETYMRHKSDGPSAGGSAEHYPLWNPREYFLLVLSRRCTQVAPYYKSMAGDGNDFFDDAQLGRTKSYTNAVYIMRKFKDTLSLSLDTFQDFQQGELLYFDTGNKQHDEGWKLYFDSIYEDLASMRYLQRVLLQKIQTFDRMKDDLVNSSALYESRYATKQGDDIGVLTNMTVAYLPFSLATGLFSMTDDSIGVRRWLLWALTLLVLGLPTFYVAFKEKLHAIPKPWKRKQAKA
ncbi:hypothetical protein A1O7_03922 [Cladophialophora yegresii CBS 114405]|uniref:Uncharacterized protein n=1 Tax=Cladophialophora yegresii CBS 114405 TaxID=1182544 RepID=W9W436_9EURO|nr:uncharacterized protein A1O7_03922 [Cladophialophora yegresii CBS 114405]EXJ59775.1 hypothetical protein A1O7_03922 [Cladophialophora yegresii CBS 114405]